MTNTMTNDDMYAMLRTKVTGSDVEHLEAAVLAAYDKIVAADPDPVAVEHYLTEPAAQFAAAQAVRGGALSHNVATATALVGALGELEAFYDAELCGC